MTRAMAPAEQAVWFALRVGAPSARTISAICHETGLCRRDVEAALESLRADLHEPICAGKLGYFDAASVAELDAYLAAFDRRLRTMLRTRTGLRLARRRMQDERTGQRTLGWVA